MAIISSTSTRSSAGCRFSAGICLYSAHTGTTEGPLLYSIGIERCYWPALDAAPRLGRGGSQRTIFPSASSDGVLVSFVIVPAVKLCFFCFFFQFLVSTPAGIRFFSRSFPVVRFRRWVWYSGAAVDWEEARHAHTGRFVPDAMLR